MRDIKFRGKPTENNTSYIEEEFVYGSLVISNGKYYIALNVNDNINRDDYEVYMIEVVPETIGQYTGLKDKNGKEIYEGDIVEYAKKYRFIVCYGEHNINPKHCAEAIIVGFYLKSMKQKTIEHLYSIDGIAARFPKHCAESEEGIENFKLQVIGNVWEDSDLLNDNKNTENDCNYESIGCTKCWTKAIQKLKNQ